MLRFNLAVLMPFSARPALAPCCGVARAKGGIRHARGFRLAISGS